uniref:Neuregulin 4 n=1 Tax=Prolemur simus TaxID=1328070 RepID=A0A8C9DV73_PROSS
YLTHHYLPLKELINSICLKFGICVITENIECNSLSKILFYRCIENYTGARCEEVFLPSSSIQTKSNLFAAFVVLVVLLVTLIIGAFYFLCRKGHLQRASSVQYDINLVETSHTSAYHSHGEH